MINPLKISEMLSKAGEMQEEMQRKLGETVVEAIERRRRGDGDHERQEGAAEDPHRSFRGDEPER